MKLPPELLNEVIGHLPTGHLHSCSLVAKSWVYPCQKRLFKVINIHPGNLRGWLDIISPADVELLGYVRILSYNAEEYWINSMNAIGPPHHALREYLPSFRQLRHFILTSLRISWSPQQLELFSAFRHTLSDISMARCGATKSDFVTLINYFPNLIHLYLREVEYYKEDEPIPPLSRPRLKRLSIAEWPANSLDLIDELSNPGLHFEEVFISKSAFPEAPWSELARRVVDAFGVNAKCLRLLDTPRDMGLSSALSKCRGLCELEVFTLFENDVELDLVSSISSTIMERIVFTHTTTFWPPPDHAFWTQLDVILTRLVGRLERGLRLELEFRNFISTRCEGSDFGEHLPKFVERGRVSVFGTRNDLIYCSDDVRERR